MDYRLGYIKGTRPVPDIFIFMNKHKLIYPPDLPTIVIRVLSKQRNEIDVIAILK